MITILPNSCTLHCGVRYSFSLFIITPRTCARGKVIGRVVVVVIVFVISTKIAISRDVGI